MSLSPIPTPDGGHLPAAATLPTASQLLADYNALSAPDKAAFRQAIAPIHNGNLDNLASLTEEGTLAGDTCSIDGAGDLWRQTGTHYGDPASWTPLLVAAPLEGAGGPQPSPEDGGRLPGPALPASRLLAAWGAMSHAQRVAFRLAIKPAFASVANQAARLALTNQVPGDYCRQTDSGLYRLRQLPSATDGNWDLLKLF